MSSTAGSETKRPALARFLARWVKIEPGEGRRLAWAFATFFLLLAGYYVLRPLRDEFGARESSTGLTRLFFWTAGGTLLGNLGFSLLVRRLPRSRFVPIVYHVLAASVIAFAALLWGEREAEHTRTIGRAFFVWISVYNLFAISVFWGFMAEVFHAEQGKRLFGLLGVAGTLGGMAGAWATSVLARHWSIPALLVLAAVAIEASILCARGLERAARAAGAHEAPTPLETATAVANARAPRSLRADLAAGLRLLLRSPYLGLICAFLVLYTASSTYAYFFQAQIVRENLVDAAERTRFFARLDLATNALSLLLGGWLAGRLMPALGIGACMACMPIYVALGFGGLALSPSLAAIALFQAPRRALEFGLVKPAREVLYTVLSHDERFAAKSLIDTLVYRLGDLLSALAFQRLERASLGASAIALSFLPLALLWWWIALRLGRRQRALAAAQAEARAATRVA